MSRKRESVFNRAATSLALRDAIAANDGSLLIHLIQSSPAEHRDSLCVEAVLKVSETAAPEMTRLLLNSGLVNQTIDKDHALLNTVNALSSGANEAHVVECAQLWLLAGANPRCLGQNGRNPAMLAVMRESTVLVETIVSATLDPVAYVNEETATGGVTQLMLAVRNGSVKLIQCLVGLGADPSRINRFGWCALDETLAAHNREGSQYLVDCMAQKAPAKDVLFKHMHPRGSHDESRAHLLPIRANLLGDLEAEVSVAGPAPLPVPQVSEHQILEIALNLARHCGDGIAVKFIRTSSAGSNRLAMACYALLRWFGCRGVPKRRPDARSLALAALPWLRSPQARDMPFARYLRGVFLHQGIGAPQCRAAGKHHVLWAAKHGNSTAMVMMSEMNRLCGEAQEALRLLRCAAGLHHTPAMLELGTTLRLSGSEAERLKGTVLIFRAAQLGDVLAMREQGAIHMANGDDRRAIEILQKAGDLGDVASHYLMSRIYARNGNVEEAARLMLAAADGGHAPALVPAALYCLFYHHQDDAPESDDEHLYFKEAVRYLKLAVRGRDSAGFYWLGYCLEHGKGIPYNPTAAIAHYNWACSMGHFRASIMVAFLSSFGAGSLHITEHLLSMIVPIVLQEGLRIGLTRLPVMLYFDEPRVNGNIPVRFHYLNTDGTLSTESYDALVSEQFLLTAAPILMVAHACAKLTQMHNGFTSPGLDSAMTLVQVAPTIEDHAIQEHVWAEGCDETVRAAWGVIAALQLGVEPAEADLPA